MRFATLAKTGGDKRWTWLDNLKMARNLPPLDPSIPAHTLAVLLRRLRDSATSRPSSSGNLSESRRKFVPLSVEEVATRYNVSRASIYAALSGRAVPSIDTLTAMVRAWSLSPDKDMGLWVERRRNVVGGMLLREDLEESQQSNAIPDWYLHIRWQDEEPLLRHWLFKEYFSECARRVNTLRWDELAAGTDLDPVTIRQIAEGRVIPTKKSWGQMAKVLSLTDRERRYGETLLKPE